MKRASLPDSRRSRLIPLLLGCLLLNAACATDHDADQPRRHHRGGGHGHHGHFGAGQTQNDNPFNDPVAKSPSPAGL